MNDGLTTAQKLMIAERLVVIVSEDCAKLMKVLADILTANEAMLDMTAPLENAARVLEEMGFDHE